MSDLRSAAKFRDGRLAARSWRDGLERIAGRASTEADMAQFDLFRSAQAKRVRDLALFDSGIDAKLLGCDLVKLRISDAAPGGSLRLRASMIQQKTDVPSHLKSPSRHATRSQRG
jgi:hypothetical protein